MTFDACANAVTNPASRAHYHANRTAIELAYAGFDIAALHANWVALPRAPWGNPGFLVAGGLSKAQLVDLYTKYMVGVAGPSREVYDEIVTAAGGFCPFCGGLGHARTVDHYLPKAFFPAFSVHPKNLVPCCRDCNTERSARFGSAQSEQSLHPYLDGAHFFDERWISAIVHMSNPIIISFTCTPPAHWSLVDSKRVETHFNHYHLARRFSVQAGAEVVKVVELRSSSLSRLSHGSFREYLNDHANSPGLDLNGWHRSMYTALANSELFTQTDFQNPHWYLGTTT